MAELLVFAVDRIGDDVYKNAKLPKRGHVITIQANGWNWGVEELTSPMFRLIKIPSVGVAALSNLLSYESSSTPGATLDPVAQTNTLQYRGFRIDLVNANLPESVVNYLKDSSRAASSFLIGSAGVAAVQAAITKNDPIADPNAIGSPASVIG